MSRVLRLSGDDATVARIAEAAIEALRPLDPERAAALRQLHQGRRQAVAALSAVQHVRVGDGSAPSPSERRAAEGWMWLAAIAVLAAVAGSAGMLPPRHPQDPTLVMQVSPPAMAIGAALMVALAAWVPAAARRISGAPAIGILVALLVGVALVLNASREPALLDAGGEAGVLVWTIAAVATLVASVVVAARTRADRPAPTLADRSRVAWRDAAADLRRDAERLARRGPHVDGTAWLTGLPDGIDADALAQAAAIGPWRWLVWSAYDGEIAVPALARA